MDFKSLKLDGTRVITLAFGTLSVFEFLKVSKDGV